MFADWLMFVIFKARFCKVSTITNFLLRAIYIVPHIRQLKSLLGIFSLYQKSLIFVKNTQIFIGLAGSLETKQNYFGKIG